MKHKWNTVIGKYKSYCINCGISFPDNNECSGVMVDRETKRRLFSFCHIPKVAGTTFENVLKNNLDNQYYRISEYKYPYGKFYEYKRDLIAIGGHYDWSFPFDCGLFEDREIVPFVLLRNPVDRAISFFYFSNPDFHSDPVKYFTDIGNGDWKYRSNTMVKFLAGINREPNEFHLELAKDRLLKSNVGFQETFDLDLMRFSELYPDLFKTIKYEYKNKCKVEKKITPELIETVKSVNGWDMQLWDWAKENLREV